MIRLAVTCSLALLIATATMRAQDASRASVTPDGRVGDTMVVRPLDPGLDAEGVKAVQQMRFVPAIASAALFAALGAPPTNLSGAWTLDTYLSDNPEQIAREIQFDTGQRQVEDLFGGADAGGRGGYGRGGFGRGSRGGGAPARAESSISADDQKLLRELVDAVQFPPPTLTISQSGDDVTIAGSSGPVTLHANGKVEKVQLESGLVERTASWQGPELVVAYRVGRAGTLKYSYLIVPTTKQLLVRVNFERDRRRGPFDIKLVYDAAR